MHDPEEGPPTLQKAVRQYVLARSKEDLSALKRAGWLDKEKGRPWAKRLKAEEWQDLWPLLRAANFLRAEKRLASAEPASSKRGLTFRERVREQLQKWADLELTDFPKTGSEAEHTSSGLIALLAADSLTRPHGLEQSESLYAKVVSPHCRLIKEEFGDDVDVLPVSINFNTVRDFTAHGVSLAMAWKNMNLILFPESGEDGVSAYFHDADDGKHSEVVFHEILHCTSEVGESSDQDTMSLIESRELLEEGLVTAGSQRLIEGLGEESYKSVYPPHAALCRALEERLGGESMASLRRHPSRQKPALLAEHLGVPLETLTNELHHYYEKTCLVWQDEMAETDRCTSTDKAIAKTLPGLMERLCGPVSRSKKA